MKCTAKGDDIVGLNGREFLDPTVNQGKLDARFRRRSLCRHDHGSFWIETRTAPDKSGEAYGKQAGTAAHVEQGFVAAQCDLPGTLLEELWRIRLPVASIEFNG